MIKINTKDTRVLVIPSHKQVAYTLSGWTERVSIVIDKLTYNQQKANVDAFIKEARANPFTKYWIVSSFNPNDELAPMFALAPKNCVLPMQWQHILGLEDNREYWYG